MGWLKGSKLYSIGRLKCPFCHEGDFFVSHPYDLSKVGEVNTRCPVCERKLSKEVGFYWGALFVSYALSIGFSLAIFGLAWMIKPDLGIMGFFITVVGATMLAAPYLYALSKIIWANLFFHYTGR
jgi:hypothetical protein